MALKIEIDDNQALSQNIQSRSGVKNDREWSMKSQYMWLFQKGSKFPVEIQFVLPEGHLGFPAGIYSLDFETAIISGAFKAPQLDTRKLELKPYPQK